MNRSTDLEKSSHRISAGEDNSGISDWFPRTSHPAPRAYLNLQSGPQHLPEALGHFLGAARPLLDVFSLHLAEHVLHLLQAGGLECLLHGVALEAGPGKREGKQPINTCFLVQGCRSRCRPLPLHSPLPSNDVSQSPSPVPYTA